ncbi:MAG: type IVB secretion system protein IcmH/DotU [Pseudomonadota bacterium]
MSDPDDPFSSPLDRTVIIPSPGGAAPKPKTPPAAARPAPARPASPAAAPGAAFDPLAADEPLVAAAAPLLLSAAQIRGTARVDSVPALRARVADEVRAFDASARTRGVAEATVLAARYMLCTMIDEAAMATPWGHEHGWSEKTLLAEFHKERDGGEKVFSIIDRAKKEPGVNAGFLQLAYYVLAFGFEGKYRVRESGHLANLVDGLYRTLQNQRPAPERALSPAWRGREPSETERLVRSIPLWTIFAAAGGLLAAAYIAFSGLLYAAARPAGDLADEIGGGRSLLLAGAAPTADFDPRTVLAPYLGRLLEFEVNGPFAIIRILGESPDGALFRTGSSDVAPSYDAALAAVSAALQQIDGDILIEGHTDTRGSAIANDRISSARAEAVSERLVADGLAAGRIDRVVGYGERSPLVEERGAADYARNRRVEIVLQAPADGSWGAPQ